MDIKQMKCPNCGAPMNSPHNKEVYCSYCGSRFIREEQPVSSRPTTDQSTPVQPGWSSQPPPPAPEPKVVYIRDKRKVPPRPRVRVLFFIVLLCFYFFPGVIYLVLTKLRQDDWDKRFGSKSNNWQNKYPPNR